MDRLFIVGPQTHARSFPMQELEHLRELFLQAPESRAAGILAVALSSLLLITVLLLVRRRKLREEYTPIWVAMAILMTIISLRLDLLRLVTRAVGAWTPSSTLFFLGELFLVLICLNYATRLSKHTSQLKQLAQESAILRARLQEALDARAAAPGDAAPRAPRP
jgi:hypothetical protein